jgi:hypothetical protein
VEITMLANDTRDSPPATMNAHERLTWAEICQRYPDEWVVVVEIQPVDEMDGVDDVAIEFCTAVVIAHHKTRKEASPSVKAAFQRYDEVGKFWTGELVGSVPRFLVP